MELAIARTFQFEIYSYLHEVCLYSKVIDEFADCLELLKDLKLEPLIIMRNY
jgi:hypothetical protein